MYSMQCVQVKEEIPDPSPEYTAGPSETDIPEKKSPVKIEALNKAITEEPSTWSTEVPIKEEPDDEFNPSCFVQVQIKRETRDDDADENHNDEGAAQDPPAQQHAAAYMRQFQTAVHLMVASQWQLAHGDRMEDDRVPAANGGPKVASTLQQAVNSIIGTSHYFAPPNINFDGRNEEKDTKRRRQKRSTREEITLKDGKYICTYCDKTYVKRENLEQHIINSHVSIAGKEVTKDEFTIRDGKFICSYCSKVYTKKYNCQQHILSVHEKKIFEKSDVDYVYENGQYFCPLCDKIFSKKYNCQQHILTHARKEKREKVKSEGHKCDYCGKLVYSSSALTNHVRTHTGEKPYQCQNCQRSFTVKANWVTHERAKKCYSKNDLTCKQCNKVFTKNVLYQSHMRSHNPEKEFVCDLCNESFKYRSTIVRHIKTHNGEKPFSCPVCGKAFRHGGLLKPHMRTHTKERPYTCPVCQKTFSLKHNLKKHLAIHRRPKILTCWVCKKVFPKESRLKYHMQRHTQEKPFQCDLCFRVFSHKQNVLRHLIAKHPDTIKWYD